MIFSIFTNAKNEPDIIEWCYYHLFILKFNHIVICDNDSDIPIIDMINKHNYLKNKVYVFKLHGGKIKNIARQKYFNIYSKLSDWTLFIDADEYLVLKNIDNIHHFINNNAMFKNNVDCITFNWKMMGSNGLLERNDKLVIDNYTNCETKFYPHVKSLVYNKNILDLLYSPHIIKVKNKIVDSSGKKMECSPFNYNYSQESCIFHYWCKSKEDWINKCKTCEYNNSCDDGSDMSGRHINRWFESLSYTNTDSYLKKFVPNIINIIKENTK